MLNVIKLLAWFEKLIKCAFHDKKFSERFRPVHILKLRKKWGILIRICAPIQTEEILSQKNQFYKNFADFVDIFVKIS